MAFSAGRDGSLRSLAVDWGPIVVAATVVALALAGVAVALFGNNGLAAAWIDAYGFPALFGLLVLEGTMLLYVAPAQVLAALGIALLVDSTAGVVALILTMAAGSTVGQYVLFAFSKRTDRTSLLAKPWFYVSEDSLRRFDRWFDRWGRLAVPVSNALPITRGTMTVPAGLADMDDVEFVALSAAGSLAFQTFWVLVAIYGLELLASVSL